MSLWTDLGFRANPYSTTPIPPTEEGERLLVGRERPLRRLTRGISSADTVPTVEGNNGVGKTSLVSIAGYSLSKDFSAGAISQLFVTLPEPFQLLPGGNLDEFNRRVYYAVARAFIEHHGTLKAAGLAVPDVDDIERWLNSPIVRGGGAGGSAAGFGLTGRGLAVNESDGFRDDGFQATVDVWLRECFPSREQGGFICLIDNLELLETSQTARQQLEALRDSLINRPGLRWVLCGARGIVRSAASSARLNGVLSDPIELGPVSDSEISEVVSRRIEAFAMDPNAYVPVDSNGFEHIYRVLNRNLRDSLKYCEDFALWLDDQDEQPEDPAEKFKLLEIWLAQQAEQYLNATGNVKPRAWRVFDDLVSFGGSCSPSDFEEFGFNSMPPMRPHIKDLEEANLVISSVADADQRRRHIALTSRGWLVNYQRSGYPEQPNS
jgi:hypothetical protein